MEKELHIIGFQVGRETYGVPITSVHEIVRVPEITAVPDSPDYIEGVINLRGKIVSVVDLRKRFGEASAQPGRKHRILVTEAKGKLVGLIVDSASEAIKLPASEVEAPPALLQEGGLNCITGVGKVKGRLIILLALEKLLQSAARPTASNDASSATKSEKAPAALKAQAGSGK